MSLLSLISFLLKMKSKLDLYLSLPLINLMTLEKSCHNKITLHLDCILHFIKIFGAYWIFNPQFLIILIYKKVFRQIFMGPFWAQSSTILSNVTTKTITKKNIFRSFLVRFINFYHPFWPKTVDSCQINTPLHPVWLVLSHSLCGRVRQTTLFNYHTSSYCAPNNCLQFSDIKCQNLLS